MSAKNNPAVGVLMKHLLEPRRMKLLAPFIVGGWLDTLFLGLIVVAFAQWVREARSTDRTWVKVLVMYLLLASIASTAAMIAHWYHVFVNGFADYTVLMTTNAARAVPAFFVLVKVPSAAFFAVRAYNLQRRPVWFPILIVHVLLACTVGGFVRSAFLAEFPATKFVLDCVLMDAVTSMSADIIISACLFHGLLKSKTGWERTDRVVSRLMALLVETQTPPMLVTICFLIISLVKPDGTALGYFSFLPKMHVLNVMINVKSRVAMGRRADGSVPSAGQYSSRTAVSSGGTNKHSFSQGQGVYVSPGGGVGISKEKPYVYGSDGTRAAQVAPAQLRSVRELEEAHEPRNRPYELEETIEARPRPSEVGPSASTTNLLYR